MKAFLHSARIAPKKANLLAKMIRGMRVPDAVDALSKTHKKSARIIEQLLRSAMANASHNAKQDPQTMIVKTIIVNQGTAYRRGMPMARGRVRPFRKFLSHISVELGFAEERAKKSDEDPSQKAKKPVKDPEAKKKKKPSDSSSSSSS